MKKRLLNKLMKKLAKKKYIFLSYYQNEKECVKRYRQNEIRVKLIKWLFSFHISEIEFLFEQPINNIYGIKFSDNEEEKKGCVNQRIKENKVIFRKDITCNYQAKSYDFEEFLKPDNKIVTLVKGSDFEVETVNYNKIEIERNYFAFNLYGKEFLIKQKKSKMTDGIMKFAPRNMKSVDPLIVTQNLKDFKCYEK